MHLISQSDLDKAKALAKAIDPDNWGSMPVETLTRVAQLIAEGYNQGFADAMNEAKKIYESGNPP